MTKVTDNWSLDDKLGRKESADFLTSYLIKRYALASGQGHADTFVLNIRADWGFGKTFFLQRWAKDLEQANFPVVFFNAWENDFCDDPLIGFIAEINDGLSDYVKEIPVAKRHLDQALAVGRKLIKPVSIGIASMILGFNRWMQHTRNCVSRRSVANETETTHLLHRNPESADVGTLAERRLSPADRTAI